MAADISLSFHLHRTPQLQVQSYLIAKGRLCLAGVKSAKDMETVDIARRFSRMWVQVS